MFFTSLMFAAAMIVTCDSGNLDKCPVRQSRGNPLMMIRLRGPHTADDEQWAKTFKVLSENRPACDEVWFSTGIGVPKMAWHEAHVKRLSRYAAQLRKVGIVPSLQVQATLGHSDDLTAVEGAEGKKWGGFTGRGGLECTYCNCPRQDGFVAYVREMSRLYASFHPGSVWIDDDLRIVGHAPGSPWDKVKDGWIGCWCPTCLAAFSAETGKSWTRESLDAAMQKDSSLFDRWERFSFSGIAVLAGAIAEEFHKISPETRFAYQHCGYRNDSQLAVFRAMHEATGQPVASRPGGGAYYDLEPGGLMIKAFYIARQRLNLGNPPWIAEWCPEIETYPRAFASRTAQGLLDEALLNLAFGANSLSFLIMDTRSETDEWYGEALLRPLAEARPLLEAYRRHNVGAQPAGLADGMGAIDGTQVRAIPLCRIAHAGIPVLPGPGKVYGKIVKEDLDGFNLATMTSSSILELRRKMDARAGGKLPVVVETPTVGLVVPQVTAEGTLRSVGMVNTRIDVQKPVTLRLRGVPEDVECVTWWAFHESPCVLPVERKGCDCLVRIPALAAWNCGWLQVGK